MKPILYLGAFPQKQNIPKTRHISDKMGCVCYLQGRELGVTEFG